MTAVVSPADRGLVWFRQRESVRREVGFGPAAWLVVATCAALVLALRTPVATAVLGLVAFGVLHNVLELRYVVGRSSSLLSGPFLALVLGLISGVAILRLLPASTVTRAGEILLGYAILATAWVRAWRGPVARRGNSWALWFVAGIGVLAGAAALSLAFPAYHFVVLTHLHNVVPLFFLWDWSGRLPNLRAGWAVRWATLGWVVVIPTLLLCGAFDRLLRVNPAGLGGFGGVAAFQPATLVRSYAWPAASPEVGLRFLAVFAFMQTMHYVVWVGVLPRFAPEVTARFEARLPVLRRRRVWLFGIGLALVLGALFAVDYASGRSLYASAASYHAYLEFPVLLALILGFAGATSNQEVKG